MDENASLRISRGWKLLNSKDFSIHSLVNLIVWFCYFPLFRQMNGGHTNGWTNFKIEHFRCSFIKSMQSSLCLNIARFRFKFSKRCSSSLWPYTPLRTVKFHSHHRVNMRGRSKSNRECVGFNIELSGRCAVHRKELFSSCVAYLYGNKLDAQNGIRSI